MCAGDALGCGATSWVPLTFESMTGSEASHSHQQLSRFSSRIRIWTFAATAGTLESVISISEGKLATQEREDT